MADQLANLSEQDMRRSCKKLMNHLYAEDSNQPSTNPTVAAGALLLAVRAPDLVARDQHDDCTIDQAQAALAFSSASPSSSSSSSSESSSSSLSSPSSSSSSPSPLPATPMAACQTQPVLRAGAQGKSYLRSSYERRQQRQLDMLHNKSPNSPQVPTMEVAPVGLPMVAAAAGPDRDASGANEPIKPDGPTAECAGPHYGCNRGPNVHARPPVVAPPQSMAPPQQDLVAKSHELSKRRFFEKLERRESIKNFNSIKLAMQPVQVQQLTTIGQQDSLLRNSGNCNNKANRMQPQTQPKLPTGPATDIPALIKRTSQDLDFDNEKQKNPDSSGDDQLMLQVYQSLARKDRSQSLSSVTLREPSSSSSEHKQVTEEAQPVELQEQLNGLIGFYKPSLKRLPLNSSAELLESSIQFSCTTVFHNQSVSHKQILSGADLAAELSEQHRQLQDESEFEIQVPALDGSDSDNNSILASQLDGFISSRLLVVKQVEPELQHQQQQQQQRPATAIHKTPIESLDQGSNSNSNATTPLEAGHKKEAEASGRLIDNKTSNESPSSSSTSTSNHSSAAWTAAAAALTQNPKEISAPAPEDINEPPAGPGLETITSCAQMNSDLPVSSDNQQQVADISSTISRSTKEEEDDQAVRPKEVAAAPAQADESALPRGAPALSTQTTGPAPAAAGPLVSGADVKEKPCGPLQTEAPPTEDAGEPNRVKGHERPEISALVGQPESGGACVTSAAGNPPNGAASRPTCATRAPEGDVGGGAGSKQSAAQVQQLGTLRTLITNFGSRDVLPQAVEFGAIATPVPAPAPAPAPASAVKSVVSTISTGCEAEKCAHNCEQHLDLARGRFESAGHRNHALDAYANSRIIHGHALDAGSLHKPAVSVAAIAATAAANEPAKGDPSALIESLSVGSGSERQPTEGRSLSGEEDGSSSCGSSGFGASNSVASSSDGFNGSKTHTTATGTSECSESPSNDGWRRPVGPDGISRVAGVDKSSDKDSTLYDTIWPNRGRAHGQQSLEYPGYEVLVGPDQSYPNGRSLLVENHNYATVINRRELVSPIIESDDPALICAAEVHYANWNPAGGKSQAEYSILGAPPRPPTASGHQRLQLNNSASAISLGQSSSSSTSVTSGGFSALPPARFECTPPANNSHSPMVSVGAGSDACEKKSSSFLKRFGSLVTKAFNTTSPTSSHPIKSNIQQANLQSLQYSTTSQVCNNDGFKTTPKSVAMQLDAAARTSAERSVQDNADLVILPTKNVNQKAASSRLPDQSNAVSRRDSRLSRPAVRNHKSLQSMMRKPRSNSSSSSASSSSSSSSSAAASTCSSHSLQPESNVRRCPRRADSLSEDLESLMSRSEENSSRHRGKICEQRQHATQSPNENKKGARRRFDIDCVSPSKVVDRVKDTGHQSGSSMRLPATYSGRRELSTAGLSINLDQRKPLHKAMHQQQQQQQQHQAPEKGEGCHKTSSRPKEILAAGLIAASHAASELTRGGGSKTGLKQCKEQQQQLLQDSKKPELRLKKHFAAIHAAAGTGFESIGYSKFVAAEPSKSASNSDDSGQLDRHIKARHHSLSLYQDFLKTHAKRRLQSNSNNTHHHHGHHHHHHHRHRRHCGHHYHHYNHHYSNEQTNNTPRHSSHNATAAAAAAARSGKKSGPASPDGSVYGEVCVKGQLIKINPSDGSQVIELQRLAGKSWGFFVARGAIDNVKGIFISRMHDEPTSNALTGLLSVGDRILEIDDTPILPDHDILRVNQMISKKAKILLKVKPFKG